MMPNEEYDLAGFAVGMVDKCDIIYNAKVAAGDVIIALQSSGVHSNGFSLIRRVFDVENRDIKTSLESLGGRSLGETLLTPTKIYVNPILTLMNAITVKAVSHITGGGFYENIPRSIPDGFCAKIERAAVKIPAIFDMLAREGGIDERDMFNTFNMGVGMSVVVAATDADAALRTLRECGEDAYIIGEIVKSQGGAEIELC
jgi:phosphoribosylformylglycinamidine cyclo-ligase